MSASPISRWITRGDLRLHVLDSGGDGAPIVFVHGGSAHAHWWDFVAPRFAPDRRVVAVDLRGHGDSAPAPDEAYRVEDYAADVAHVLDALALERPVLVGHSLGAFVSLRLAGDRPRALAGLVLVDARATFGTGSSRYMRLLRMFTSAEYETLDDAVDRFSPLPRETVAAPHVLDHVARRSFRRSSDGRWVLKFDRATLAGHQPFDFREILPVLEFPVLFVRGSESRILSAKAAAELAALCRRGSWIEIAGAHHHVLLDRPEELGEAIAGFLAREGV